ncbi:MAG: MBL fold metallo-hydrolase [Candidatus Andersenbacteria bacterium]|nr:MBL fold metallo-hydrolase [Candidatus Andersenbacteria bacterium]MBI3250675.1 MBL fold metallo-hydrolase [Candidatus Andersenbacteria bacterium]
MQISWHGGYTIKIVSKETVLVMDPYAPELSPTPFRAKADVVALSHPTQSNMSHLKGISGEPQVIDSPGEYTLRGFTLQGLGLRGEDGHEYSIFRWHIEGIVILYLGALPRVVDEKELGEITKTDIDVLIVPVGGGESLTSKQAAEMISHVEPRMIIPIHFALPKWKEKLDPVDVFAKEMGVSASKVEKKLVLRPSRLPDEDVETVILKP